MSSWASIEKQYDVTSLVRRSEVKKEYNSLQDVHLAHHFRRPVVFRHLLCMGLVTPDGRVVTDREWLNVQRFSSEKEKHARISRLRSLASEGNLRKPTAKFPDDKRRIFSTEDRSSPFPFFTKRKGIVGEPYLDSVRPKIQSKHFQSKPFQSKPFIIQSAGGTKITKCSQVWERLFPPPSSCGVLCWKQDSPTAAVLRLRYMKKINNMDVMIYQQPSGISSRSVYNGTVSYRDEFEFSSYRKDKAAFSLTIYENNICTSRLNTCCEYRYSCGKRIGGPSGHFLVVNIEGGQPCSRCTKTSPMTIRKPQIISLNDSMDSKITIDIELDQSETDITSNPLVDVKKKAVLNQNNRKLKKLSLERHSSISYNSNSFTDVDSSTSNSDSDTNSEAVKTQIATSPEKISDVENTNSDQSSDLNSTGHSTQASTNGSSSDTDHSSDTD